MEEVEDGMAKTTMHIKLHAREWMSFKMLKVDFEKSFG